MEKSLNFTQTCLYEPWSLFCLFLSGHLRQGLKKIFPPTVSDENLKKNIKQMETQLKQLETDLKSLKKSMGDGDRFQDVMNISFQKEKIKKQYYLGLDAWKPVFGGLGTTKAQTSLRVRPIWSSPLLFPFLKEWYLDLLQVKFQFSS